MGLVDIPNRPGGGGTRSISQLLDNFDAILDEFNGNVTQENLAAGSVGTSELIDGSVTAPKLDAGVSLSLVSGLVIASANQALTTGMVDLTGCTATFTPDTPCQCVVMATMGVTGLVDNHVLGQLMVDAVAQTAQILIDGGSGGSYSSGSQVFRFALTAASHTLKLQGMRGADATSTEAVATRFIYLLIPD